jgi:phage terminase large subunit
MTDVIIQFPEKLKPLFDAKTPYRVAEGGRGGGKSEGFGGWFLLEGLTEYHTYLCVREIQRSIQQSVYATLEKAAHRMGIYDDFEWLKTQITAKGTNSKYLFGGLVGQTALNLKSIPDIDRCWVEEAQSVSGSSWKILKPTVFRNKGAQIWVSLNPVLETDPIYADLLAEPRPDVTSVRINLDDNPWASPENKSERDRDYAKDPIEAAHIWGGGLRPTVEGAIYGKEMGELETSGRLGLYPHRSSLDTLVAFDLGGSSKTADHTSFVLGQHASGERRICMSYEGRGNVFSHYIDVLKRTGYRIDKIALPHDAENHNALTPGTIADMCREAFPQADVVVLDRTSSVASDINFVRERFETITLNKANNEALIQSLRCYRWDISDKTGLARKPLHDTYSDTADAFRYWMMQEAPSRKEQIAASAFATNFYSQTNPFQ